ncbi:MAG: glycosyltransferase family 2 protein [Bacteroidia bacterium]|nr:glycosyltransferase family 2 protein [Bacteroidia bacterium]
MLSILIPILNYDVEELVNTLLGQCQELKIDFEIILMDDGSDEWYTSGYDKLAISANVVYHRNIQNQGRWWTRISLAQEARYDHLLFLDADAQIVRNNFVRRYIDVFNHRVIAGGHLYQSNRPEVGYLLHWKYGKEIEARTLKERQRRPYQSFSTFNFCIEKALFLNIVDGISHKGYGHEDSIIGHLLKQRKETVNHIDNPLLHTGLKSVDHFLSDSVSAIENVIRIADQFPDLEIKALRISKLIKRLGLISPVQYLLELLYPFISKNLNSDRPLIVFLQFYKLTHFLRLNSTNQSG